jgi:hypothetical protein
MALIHPISSIVPLPYFDIYKIPKTQGTVISNIESEHRPNATLDSKAVIEFEFKSAQEEYFRLDHAWLYLKLRVTIAKPLDVAVVADDWKKVSTVNNLLNSLFKQIDLYIGDRQVSLSHPTYPYKTDIEIKLGKSKDAKKSHLTACFWYEDNVEDPEEINPTRSSFIAPLSTSSDKKVGKELDLMGRIHLPMFEQKNALIGDTYLKLRLIPNDPAFYMLTTQDVKIKLVEFTECSIEMHRSKFTTPTVINHHKALETSNAKYTIRENFVVPVTINKGFQDIIIDNIHNGQLPRRAFVAFVTHSAYNGSYTLNPFNYKHFDLNHLAFFLDGTQYPSKPLTPDFDNGLFIRSYLSIFNATNQTNTESCINISRQNYTKGNVIFGFNFAPDLSSGCCATPWVNPIRRGNIRIHLRFKNPLAQPITMLVYLDYDSLLEITPDKNVIYDFN